MKVIRPAKSNATIQVLESNALDLRARLSEHELQDTKEFLQLILPGKGSYTDVAM